MSRLRHVGRETKKILGEAIVTGKAQYTADFKLPGMQYGKILRSPHPYARIVEINTAKAKALVGVTAVLTWQDVSRDIYVTNGFTPPKHHHIMDEYVRFIGDAVALVVAISEDIANDALDLIDVKYEVLAPVFTINQAIAEGASQLYPEFPGNIAPHKTNIKFEVGNIADGFAQADAIVEMEAALESGQNPLPVEPPVIIAQWKEDTVEFIASAAAPAYCHQNVASSLNIPYEQVRVTAPAVGGSFGSKLYSGNVHVLLFAAIMAKTAHCPVYFCYTKEEHLAVHQNRMRTQGCVKFGMKKDGTATAIEVSQFADAGCCASTQEFMLQVGTNTLTMLCKTNNKKYNADVVVTNHIPSGSFRGYGYLESTSLLSNAIFDCCEKLDVDPVTYFEKNAMKKGEVYYNAMAGPHYMQTNKTADWDNLVRETAKAFGWSARWQGWGKPTYVSPNGRYVRGIGVAAAGHSDTGGKPSNANVTLTGLGALYVATCMTDFGAGTREVMQKVAAEAMNISLDSVRLTPSDTAVTPLDFGSTASRSTYCGGIAVKYACDDLRSKLFARAEERLGIPADDCDFCDGFVFRKSNPDEKYSLFPRLMGKVDGLTGCGHFDGVENSTIYHLQFVEVEVDTKMGTFEIIEHFGGSDAGVIVNPLPLRNQVQSFFGGIDIACMEETVWDPNDFRVLNPTNIDYKVRTFNDAPKHDHIVLESNKGVDNDYPFGAYGVGEPLLAPGGPAIRMAIYNACGIKLNNYPFTPDKILAALNAKEGK